VSLYQLEFEQKYCHDGNKMLSDFLQKAFFFLYVGFPEGSTWDALIMIFHG